MTMNMEKVTLTLRTTMMSWPEFHFTWRLSVKILMAGWPRFLTEDAARWGKNGRHFDWLSTLETFNGFLTNFYLVLTQFDCPTVGQARFSDEVAKNLGWKCSTLSAAKHRLLAPKTEFEFWFVKLFFCRTVRLYAKKNIRCQSQRIYVSSRFFKSKVRIIADSHRENDYPFWSSD